MHSISETKPPLSLDALAMQSLIGDIIPDTLGERDLSLIFRQVFQELALYSEAGIHYRDPHNGNILFRWVPAPPDSEWPLFPRLVLIDFGSARHGWRKRGQAQAADEEAFSPRDIGEDDSRAGNRYFQPSCLQYLAHSLSFLEGSPADCEFTRRHAREAVTWSHRYIDDLESCFYVQWLHGGRRSGWRLCSKDGWDRATIKKFDETLSHPSKKCSRWPSDTMWPYRLEEHCAAMSPEWRDMMARLQATIFAAQKEVRSGIREYLADKDPTLRETVKCLEPVTDRERQCFKDCIEIFDQVIPTLPNRSFPSKKYR